MYSASGVGREVQEFINFVDRLPMSDEQKQTFVKNHINSIKKHQEEKKENKNYFTDNVIAAIGDCKMSLIGINSLKLVRS
jgi:hypothetical protein